MSKRIIMVVFLIIIFGLITNASATISIDDFESYTSDTALQNIWEWTGVIVGDATVISLSTSGGSDADQAMQVDFSFSNRDRDPWGYTGGYVNNGNPEDWSGKDSLRVWLRASETGDTPQYIQLAIHEGNGGSGDWGDKFHSANVYINDLNSAGEYVSLAFADFTDYGGYGGTRDNGVLELDDIRSIFVFSKYDGRASQSSSASILVDDITVEGITTTVPPVRYPYLQNVTQTSVKVMWGSNETTGKVFWGNVLGDYTNSAPSVAFQDNSGVYVHTAVITGLTTGETVYYYVQNGNSGNVGFNDATYYAVAAPASDADFRFVFYSDSHADTDIYQTAVINAMLPHDPSIVLHGGDHVAEGAISEFNDYYFSNAAPLLKNTPVFNTIGNHDMPYSNPTTDGPTTDDNYDKDIENYHDLFDHPTNNSIEDGTEDYYSFDYGSAHFVCLNTQRVQNGGIQGQYYYSETYNDSMKAWLDRDLKGTNKPWKVVFFHKPTYMSYVESQGWSAIFESNGVQLVLSGHHHNYMAHEVNSVIYVMSGGGGTGGLGANLWWAWPNNRIGAFRDYNFAQVDITQTKLYVKIYNEKDILRHSFETDVAGNLSNNVAIPPQEEVDDFENFADAVDFQETWEWYGGDNGGALERYLDTGGVSGSSNVMRMEFSFPSRSTDPYGYAGFGGLWDWVGYTGVELWIKASESGATPQYFEIKLHEGSGGDRWKYSVPIANLDPNGGYITANFDEYVWYDDGGSGDGVMNLDRIVSFFVGASFPGKSVRLSGAATIYVDEIKGISSSPKILNMDPQAANLPEKFVLHQNYPNPFNPVSTIKYDIPKTADVQLIIYDVLGREIASLVNSRLDAGYHTVQWNGSDQYGERVSSGVYVYLLKAGDYVTSKKLLLLK